ncbi:hypothetical protein EKK58_07575 [Candidatus Dependentiae bacterium]|nr:MAG: hypothetical protein EKK58_07575 [Candidatus Dependentiae bacterium]
MSQKLKNGRQWGKDIIDYITKFHAFVPSMSTSYVEMERNYKLFNNIINQKDFEAECNPLGIEVGQMEDEIKPYNKIPNKIQVLLGEELRRPFVYKAVLVSEDGIKSKLRRKNEMITQYVEGIMQMAQLEAQQTVAKQQEQNGEISPEQAQQMQEQAQQQIQQIVDTILPPEHIDKYLHTTYQESSEILANKLLNYLGYALDLKSKRNDTFKHGLISDVEAAWVGIENESPQVNVINPLALFYHKSTETKFIQDGLYAGYRVRMSTLDVLNLFGDYLTKEEVDEVQRNPSSLTNYSSWESEPEMKYHFSDTHLHHQNAYLTTPIDGTYGRSYTLDHLISHVEWQSESKIGYFTSPNEYGDMETVTVTEDFPIPPYAEISNVTDEWGANKMVYTFDDCTLTFQWVPQTWSGIRIGGDKYAKIAPKPYQVRSYANPKRVKLGYHGIVYSNMNATSCSLVSRMKPFQYLYFIVMHKLKHLIARDKGQLLSIDTTQIPGNVDHDKIMYYIEQMDLNFYNPLQNAEQPGSAQRGKPVEVSSRSNMKHIMNYVQLLDNLDVQIADVAGVNKQREGQISSNEAVTNSQQNLQQSATITESYFYLHSKLWEDIYNSLLETASYVWKDKEQVFQWVLDDLSAESLVIKPGDLSFGQMGVFVLESSKQHEAFDFAKQHMLELLQNDKAKFSDLLNLFQTSSLAEFKRTIEKSEREMQQRAEQEQQMQKQMQDEELQTQIQLSEMAHAQAMEIEQLKADTAIRKAEIDVFKFQQELDSNSNGVPDPLEIEKLRHQVRQADEKLKLEKDKLKQTKEIKEEELKIKKIQANKRPSKS